MFECKARLRRPSTNGVKGDTILYSTSFLIVAKENEDLVVIGNNQAVHEIAVLEESRVDRTELVIHPKNLINVKKKLIAAL